MKNHGPAKHLGADSQNCCHRRVQDEFEALRQSVGWLDFSSRSRLCVLGDDRVKFLHGQVTNDIEALTENTGCYAALVNAKGKMESDLFVYRLAEELLLDFEPDLAGPVRERLEKYVITEDVEIADVAPHFKLLSIQGPESPAALDKLDLPCPRSPYSVAMKDEDIYVINQPRLGTAGFDLFVATEQVAEWQDKLSVIALHCSEASFEQARILATIPRFGADLTVANLPPEGGLESRAISYSKGCYIGQEIIARIRTYGQVRKLLRGLRLTGAASIADEVVLNDKVVGRLSSVATEAGAALAIIQRESCKPGTKLQVRTNGGQIDAVVATMPYEPFPEE